MGWLVNWKDEMKGFAKRGLGAGGEARWGWVGTSRSEPPCLLLGKVAPSQVPHLQIAYFLIFKPCF